jgi:hypothetical protein
MKLSDLASDPIATEQGEWVDNIPEMGDLRLKVRGIGNADWRRIQMKLIDAVPRAKRTGTRIDPEEIDKITTICLHQACLLDWENLNGDDGKPLSFSRDFALELLSKPQYRKFREAVVWAATVVGEQTAVKIEDQKGHSVSASSGN